MALFMAHLTGHVNRHNSRIWSDENPREIQERPLHSLRVTVWCGISASRVYGPYFFENDNATVTVTGERYRSMITEFLTPELERQNVHYTWFQQDGATAHTARETMTLLKDCFPNRLISRFGDIPWPLVLLIWPHATFSYVATSSHEFMYQIQLIYKILKTTFIMKQLHSLQKH